MEENLKHYYYYYYLKSVEGLEPYFITIPEWWATIFYSFTVRMIALCITPLKTLKKRDPCSCYI